MNVVAELKTRPISLSSTTLAHVVLALACAVLMWLHPIVENATLTGLTVLFALGKSVAYALLLRALVIRSGPHFHEFLTELTLLSFTVMSSFAFDFFVVYAADPTSLQAMDPKWGGTETLFNCWYFSVLNFGFFGISDIIPVSFAAKLLLVLEALMSFLTVMFVLSDFIALKDSLARGRASPR